MNQNTINQLFSPSTYNGSNEEPLPTPAVKQLNKRVDELLAYTPSQFSFSPNDVNIYNTSTPSKLIVSPSTPITKDKVPFSRSNTAKKHFHGVTLTPEDLVSPPNHFSPLLSSRKKFKSSGKNNQNGNRIILSQYDQNITVITEDTDNYILTNKPIVSFGGVPIGEPHIETLTLRNNRKYDLKIKLEMNFDDPDITESDGYKLLSTNILDLKAYTDTNQYSGIIYVSVVDTDALYQIPLYGYGGISDLTCYVLQDPVEMKRNKNNSVWEGIIEIVNSGTRCATVYALLDDPEHELGKEFANRLEITPNCFTLNYNERQTVNVTFTECPEDKENNRINGNLVFSILISWGDEIQRMKAFYKRPTESNSFKSPLYELIGDTAELKADITREELKYIEQLQSQKAIDLRVLNEEDNKGSGKMIELNDFDKIFEYFNWTNSLHSNFVDFHRRSLLLESSSSSGSSPLQPIQEPYHSSNNNSRISDGSLSDISPNHREINNKNIPLKMQIQSQTVDIQNSPVVMTTISNSITLTGNQTPSLMNNNNNSMEGISKDTSFTNISPLPTPHYINGKVKFYDDVSLSNEDISKDTTYSHYPPLPTTHYVKDEMRNNNNEESLSNKRESTSSATTSATSATGLLSSQQQQLQQPQQPIDEQLQRSQEHISVENMSNDTFNSNTLSPLATPYYDRITGKVIYLQPGETIPSELQQQQQQSTRVKGPVSISTYSTPSSINDSINQNNNNNNENDININNNNNNNNNNSTMIKNGEQSFQSSVSNISSLPSPHYNPITGTVEMRLSSTSSTSQQQQQLQLQSSSIGSIHKDVINNNNKSKSNSGSEEQESLSSSSPEISKHSIPMTSIFSPLNKESQSETLVNKSITTPLSSSKQQQQEAHSEILTSAKNQPAANLYEPSLSSTMSDISSLPSPHYCKETNRVEFLQHNSNILPTINSNNTSLLQQTQSHKSSSRSGSSRNGSNESSKTDIDVNIEINHPLQQQQQQQQQLLSSENNENNNNNDNNNSGSFSDISSLSSVTAVDKIFPPEESTSNVNKSNIISPPRAPPQPPQSSSSQRSFHSHSFNNNDNIDENIPSAYINRVSNHIELKNTDDTLRDIQVPASYTSTSNSSITHHSNKESSSSSSSSTNGRLSRQSESNSNNIVLEGNSIKLQQQISSSLSNNGLNEDNNDVENEFHNSIYSHIQSQQQEQSLQENDEGNDSQNTSSDISLLSPYYNRTTGKVEFRKSQSSNEIENNMSLSQQQQQQQQQQDSNNNNNNFSDIGSISQYHSSGVASTTASSTLTSTISNLKPLDSYTQKESISANDLDVISENASPLNSNDKTKSNTESSSNHCITHSLHITEPQSFNSHHSNNKPQSTNTSFTDLSPLPSPYYNRETNQVEYRSTPSKSQQSNDDDDNNNKSISVNKSSQQQLSQQEQEQLSSISNHSMHYNNNNNNNNEKSMNDNISLPVISNRSINNNINNTNSSSVSSLPYIQHQQQQQQQDNDIYVKMNDSSMNQYLSEQQQQQQPLSSSITPERSYHSNINREEESHSSTRMGSLSPLNNSNNQYTSEILRQSQIGEGLEEIEQPQQQNQQQSLSSSSIPVLPVISNKDTLLDIIQSQQPTYNSETGEVQFQTSNSNDNDNENVGSGILPTISNHSTPIQQQQHQPQYSGSNNTLSSYQQSSIHPTKSPSQTIGSSLLYNNNNNGSMNGIPIENNSDSNLTDLTPPSPLQSTSVNGIIITNNNMSNLPPNSFHSENQSNHLSSVHSSPQSQPQNGVISSITNTPYNNNNNNSNNNNEGEIVNESVEYSPYFDKETGEVKFIEKSHSHSSLSSIQQQQQQQLSQQQLPIMENTSINSEDLQRSIQQNLSSSIPITTSIYQQQQQQQSPIMNNSGILSESIHNKDNESYSNITPNSIGIQQQQSQYSPQQQQLQPQIISNSGILSGSLHNNNEDDNYSNLTPESISNNYNKSQQMEMQNSLSPNNMMNELSNNNNNNNIDYTDLDLPPPSTTSIYSSLAHTNNYGSISNNNNNTQIPEQSPMIHSDHLPLDSSILKDLTPIPTPVYDRVTNELIIGNNSIKPTNSPQRPDQYTTSSYTHQSTSPTMETLNSVKSTLTELSPIPTPYIDKSSGYLKFHTSSNISQQNMPSQQQSIQSIGNSINNNNSTLNSFNRSQQQQQPSDILPTQSMMSQQLSNDMNYTNLLPDSISNNNNNNNNKNINQYSPNQMPSPLLQQQQQSLSNNNSPIYSSIQNDNNMNKTPSPLTTSQIVTSAMEHTGLTPYMSNNNNNNTNIIIDELSPLQQQQQQQMNQASLRYSQYNKSPEYTQQRQQSSMLLSPPQPNPLITSIDNSPDPIQQQQQSYMMNKSLNNNLSPSMNEIPIISGNNSNNVSPNITALSSQQQQQPNISSQYQTNDQISSLYQSINNNNNNNERSPLNSNQQISPLQQQQQPSINEMSINQSNHNSPLLESMQFSSLRQTSPNNNNNNNNNNNTKLQSPYVSDINTPSINNINGNISPSLQYKSLSQQKQQQQQSLDSNLLSSYPSITNISNNQSPLLQQQQQSNSPNISSTSPFIPNSLSNPNISNYNEQQQLQPSGSISIHSLHSIHDTGYDAPNINSIQGYNNNNNDMYNSQNYTTTTTTDSSLPSQPKIIQNNSNLNFPTIESYNSNNSSNQPSRAASIIRSNNNNNNMGGISPPKYLNNNNNNPLYYDGNGLKQYNNDAIGRTIGNYNYMEPERIRSDHDYTNSSLLPSQPLQPSIDIIHNDNDNSNGDVSIHSNITNPDNNRSPLSDNNSPLSAPSNNTSSSSEPINPVTSSLKNTLLSDSDISETSPLESHIVQHRIPLTEPHYISASEAKRIANNGGNEEDNEMGINGGVNSINRRMNVVNGGMNGMGGADGGNGINGTINGISGINGVNGINHYYQSGIYSGINPNVPPVAPNLNNSNNNNGNNYNGNNYNGNNNNLSNGSNGSNGYGLFANGIDTGILASNAKALVITGELLPDGTRNRVTTFQLLNKTDEPQEFSIFHQTEFLSISPSQGTIPPHSAQTISVEVITSPPPQLIKDVTSQLLPTVTIKGVKVPVVVVSGGRDMTLELLVTDPAYKGLSHSNTTIHNGVNSGNNNVRKTLNGNKRNKSNTKKGKKNVTFMKQKQQQQQQQQYDEDEDEDNKNEYYDERRNRNRFNNRTTTTEYDNNMNINNNSNNNNGLNDNRMNYDDDDEVDDEYEKGENISKLSVRRKGVYFYEKSLKFPRCTLGKYCVKEVRLCNNTHSKVKVKVLQPQSPFSIKKSVYLVKPLCYTHVKVYFRPKTLSHLGRNFKNLNAKIITDRGYDQLDLQVESDI